MILGDGEPPPHLAARAAHVLHSSGPSQAGELVAELRARIPRDVGVTGEGAEATAIALRQAGLPVTLYRDGGLPSPDLEGIRTLPL
ncbi:MAG: hypothetical protein QOG03_2352, partial [Actinomycetota bacterium]|nr:hypothetical protein [Actinomycetota bacterium]